jgi:ABC-type dipeptide/oligopeptide/nickel transport system ATPase component
MKVPHWFVYCTYAGFGIVGFMVVAYLVLTVWQVSARSSTSGQVTGIVGRMGSGKSYTAVRIALDRLGRGVDVASNFKIDTEALGLKGKWIPFTGWDQFATLKNCVVIVDEAHLYAPSSAHLHFPMVAKRALAFARKNGLDVFWISQHEDRVNRSLKDLTSTMMLVESYFSGKMFVLKGWEPEDFRKAKKHLTRRMYLRKKAIMSAYDTTELVEVDEYALKGDVSAKEVRKLEAERAQAPKRLAHRSPTAAVIARSG